MKLHKEILKIIYDIVDIDYLETNPYYNFCPSLYDGEIDDSCPFFENNIDLNIKGLSSEDLKTISYLAIFNKERFAYSNQFIENYEKLILSFNAF